ncbi:MAG: alpha-L-fucosidase, partial [Bacteroidota bacterium]
MKTKLIVVLIIFIVSQIGCSDTNKEKINGSKSLLIEKAVSVKPHQRQFEWQQNEFTAFIHFGVNTFTGREWGTGFEDPKIFNPKRMDTDQWCKAIKAAGMKMVILTAKHHDGFCLWQTRYTKHSVASSAWQDGKGDVMK